MKDTIPMPKEKPLVRIAPNNPVFDLPVIVGIEEKLFDKAGLNVRFTGTYADREKDSVEFPVMARMKEQMFDCGSADSYNVCEWASIDRLEKGKRRCALRWRRRRSSRSTKRCRCRATSPTSRSWSRN
jgi:hypothetical protein